MAQILYNALALSGAPLPDDAAQEAALQEIQEVREGRTFPGIMRRPWPPCTLWDISGA